MNNSQVPEHRILVVEDHPFVRNTIKLMLRAFDSSEIIYAADGTEALTLLHDGFQANVVICDLHMAPMDGLTFLRTIRNSADPRETTLPVIMLTAVADEAMIRGAIELGISGYLLKPVSPKQLTAAIHTALA